MLFFFFFPRRKHKKVLTGVKEMEDSGVGWGVVGSLYFTFYTALNCSFFSNNIYSPLSLSTGVI